MSHFSFPTSSTATARSRPAARRKESTPPFSPYAKHSVHAAVVPRIAAMRSKFALNDANPASASAHATELFVALDEGSTRNDAVRNLPSAETPRRVFFSAPAPGTRPSVKVLLRRPARRSVEMCAEEGVFATAATSASSFSRRTSARTFRRSRSSRLSTATCWELRPGQ